MALSRRTQTRGVEISSAGSSLDSWALELCLGREKEEHPKFLKNFNNRMNRNFFVLQEFIRQHNQSVKNCLSLGKTSAFPQLCTESEEYKG
jgi:hypothetical protein